MRPPLRRIGKYAGYGLFTLLMVAYFSFLTFPFDSIKDRYLARGTQGLPYRLSVESVQATPLLWIRAEEIEILPNTGEKPEALLTLREARLRPSLLRLLTGRLAFRIKAALYGGKIKGRAGKSEETVDLSFDWKDIALEQLPVKARLPEAQLKGLVGGEMDLRLRVQGNSLIPSEGKLNARLTGGSVKGLQVRGFSLPALEAINGQAALTVGNNRATLESLTVDADSLSFSLEGKTDLSGRLSNSPVNLKGKIKLSGPLASQYQTMLAGFLRKQDKEGFYTFSIRGTVGNPRFSP